MMIKELKNVIEVVDDLKASNLVNVQILKKALTDINGRLEEISDGDELMFIRNSIAQFKEALDFKFSNIMERIKELKVSAGDDSAAVENATLLEDKFKSVSSIFDSGMKLLSTKLDDIENSFSRVAAANIETAKEEFAKLSKELKVNQQEIVETHKTFDENTIERFSFVAESIKMLSENLNVQTNLYKEFIDRKTSEIRDYVEANENGIKEDNALVRTELEDKFKEIEKANSGLAAELEQIKDSVNDVIAKSDKILQGTSQGLGTQLEEVSDAVREILTGIENFQNFSETINQSLEKIIDFNEKHDYADILNTLSELEKFDIGFINEFTAIKTSLDNILSEMEKLPVNTSKAVALELKSVTEIAEDTLAEIKVLQNFSGNILRSVDKISELTENNQDKEAILQTIKALEGANTAFAGELEVIKDTVTGVLDKTDTLVTSQSMAAGLKSVTDLTQETLAEVKTLQSFSDDILKSVDKISGLTENNQDKEAILQTMKALEGANTAFAGELEVIKDTVGEVLDKADTLVTSQNMAAGLKNVTDLTQETLDEVKTLQNFSGDILKSVDKLAVLAEGNDKEIVLQVVKQLEEANIEFANDLDTIKASITEVLNKADSLPDATSQQVAGELKTVTDVARDALSEIKVLQDYSTNIIKSVNKIADYTDKNQNEDIFEAIKELDITQNIADLFEKVEIFNNNFNIKTEFLEEQIQQMKTMFSDIAIDMQNKEAELLQKESQKVQDYYSKIETVSDSMLILEESLKASGVEYQENIAALNKQLNDFIAEFNTIYNELSGTAQLEINNSLEELKQFISVNSSNYNDKLVIIQEQFTQAFKDLYEVLKTNNFELIESGQHAKDATEAHNKLLESISAKIDTIAGNDLTEELISQNEETQELVQILNAKVDSLLNIDFNAVSDKQMLFNKKFLEYFENLSEKAANLTALAELSQNDTEALELNRKILALINEIDSKIDILATVDNAEDIQEILGNVSETKTLIAGLEAKLDTFAGVENSDNLDELLDKTSEISKLVSGLDAKLDTLAAADYEDDLAEMSDKISHTTSLVKALDAKVDIISASDYEENFDEISGQLSDNKELIQRLDKKLDSLDFSDDFEQVLDKVSSNKNLLDELHTKLDVFVSTNDSDLLEDELQEIKDIILEQKEILNQSNNDNASIVAGNIEKLLSKIDGISATISEHDENSSKIKEDLVSTIVSVFSSSNFVEETEDIKDFVEEKTGELSKQLTDVKSRIETIKQNDVADYSYTLADVESDIAKLRQAMNELSISTPAPSAEFNQISRNIHNLTSSVDAISKNLTPAEIYQLKQNILKLNDDILSISSRTNKLLLNSDESQKTIADGLTAFSHIAFNLEERMNELSNKEFNKETAEKLERIMAMQENAASMDATFHKALMYLGEWVDAASDTIENINDKADEINDVSEALSELRKAVPEKLALIDLLEERFEEQQSRMDRLETKIDELTEMTKLNSNLSIIQKVDKMERMLSSLGANIEKLTSYVD